ncbi:protein kinase [Nonomuraea sp. K274]|uniref:Protein kinase n=1 Tax=Nonomuraea cypriaca TaxID=1187855 RepID=A0A931A5M6_9ACTN|nr:serine/threonine protein kinase [Nonomuraea cypriaca]MBF8185445.1 protein kinase [Nonomuraea cypriaca]
MAETNSSQPERIGGHEVVGRLGEGPRGVVYLGVHLGVPLGQDAEGGPRVAIKTLRVDPVADPDFVARLKGVAQVSSSYVARTMDAGVENGLAYVVREHVEGRSLAEAVAADGPLTGDALERVAVGMLTALTAVHLGGFAHRGLTPSNVILTGEGLRVTDIEIGDPAGEAGYQAPEQINRLRYGPHADVFAWAATVVFAATGAAPFGQDPQAVLNGEPVVGELPEPLRQVVLSALTKDVAGRPTTSTALLRLLGGSDTAKSGSDAAKGGSGAAEPASPIEGVPVPPPAPASPAGQAPPAILPIQLAVEVTPIPPAPTWQPPGHPAPTNQGPTQPGPIQRGSMQSGPMNQAPMHQGPMQEGPMQSGPMYQGPMNQGPAQPGPMGQGPMHPQGPVPPQVPMYPQGPAPVPQVWGPPPAAPQNPSQPPTIPRQNDGPARKPFPIGLAAGVTAVVLLSGLGLWGASEYSSKVQLSPVAASTGEAAAREGDASSAQGAVTVPPTQPQAEVTAPWATTPSPDDSGVGPMTLPTDGSSTSPEVPVLTSVPTPSALPTQPVAVPTNTPPAATATPTQGPRKSKTPKPKATVTRTVQPTPTPTPTKPTEEPAPTPTKDTPKPTPTKKDTPKPTPVKTTSQPVAKKNPYSATQVCGSGFSVQRQSSFDGGTTYQLWNNSSSQNCVVTLKSGADVGKKTPVKATLEVQGGSSKTDSGSYEYYAGPVTLTAKGKCVRYSGSAGSGSTSAGWANCG